MVTVLEPSAYDDPLYGHGGAEIVLVVRGYIAVSGCCTTVQVILLGDAAHGMYTGPGQGARMAFEDAHQLMLALKQHWPDTAAVAQQFQVGWHAPA